MIPLFEHVYVQKCFMDLLPYEYQKIFANAKAFV